MPFRRLVTHPPFTVDLVDGPGPDLVISFSSIGHDPTRPPAPEFVATATGRGARRALFVSDARRSWANDAGFVPALGAALSQIGPVRRTLALGVSMGGFAALAAAGIAPVDVVLAFSPQWSVLRGIVPGERRWSNWTAALPAPLWPTAPLPARAWICLFHGMTDDLDQALCFPPGPGRDHLLFPGLGHSDLVPHLKTRGVLAGLVEAGLVADRRRLLRIAASAGGRLRHRFPNLPG